MVWDPRKSLDELGSKISDNKTGLLGTALAPGSGSVLGSTYDKNGAGSKTFGAGWDDNKNAIRGAALAATVPGVIDPASAATLGSTQDKNGFLAKSGVMNPGNYGLGSYTTDGIDTTGANNLQQQAALGATTAQNRVPVSQPLSWNGVTAQQLNTNNYNQDRGGQLSLVQQLQNQANGVGPSLAQNQLQAGNEANIKAAMALGASQNGLNAGQNIRQIQDATANSNLQTAQQAANLRLQEQQGAQQQLGSVLSGVSGQDLNVANNNSNLAQQANIQNSLGALQAQSTTGAQALQQQQQNDALVQAYMNQGMTLEMAKMQAATAQNQLNSNNYNAGQTRIGNFLGAFGSGAASALTAGAAG